jgi:hypothetical protein
MDADFVVLHDLSYVIHAATRFDAPNRPSVEDRNVEKNTKATECKREEFWSN